MNNFTWKFKQALFETERAVYLVRCLAKPKKTANQINPLIKKKRKPTQPNRFNQEIALLFELEFSDTYLRCLFIFVLLTVNQTAKLIFLFSAPLTIC
jgi:hypothetical protein